MGFRPAPGLPPSEVPLTMFVTRLAAMPRRQGLCANSARRAQRSGLFLPQKWCVCGDACRRMAVDVDQALCRTIATGVGLDEDGAKAYLATMPSEHLYQRDVHQNVAPALSVDRRLPGQRRVVQ